MAQTIWNEGLDSMIREEFLRMQEANRQQQAEPRPTTVLERAYARRGITRLVGDALNDACCNAVKMRKVHGVWEMER